MSKADWEQNHVDRSLLVTPTNPNWGLYSREALYGVGMGTGVCCDEFKYRVTFWYEVPQSQKIDDALVMSFQFHSQSTDPDVKLAEARALMPVDAQLKEKGTGSAPHNRLFAIYHSKSLEMRYPPLPSVPDPWKDNTPGDIFVIYDDGDLHFGSVRANLTKLPPLAPPTEVPPTSTPFILLPTEVPTKPLPIVPTPIPTGGGILPTPVPTGGGVLPTPVAKVDVP